MTIDTTGPNKSAIALVGAGGFIGARTAQTCHLAGIDCVRIARATHGDFINITEEWLPSKARVIFAAGIIPQKRKPHSTWDSSQEVLRRAAEAAANADCAQFLLLSSASVYGTHRLYPLSEADDAQPNGDYGRYCLAMEDLAREILPKSKLSVLRPFNVYGPGGQGLVDRILTQATSHVTSNPIRDYIGVEQVADAIVALDGHHGVLNLGTGIGRSNAEVVQLIGAMCPSTIKSINLLERQGVDCSVANPAKAISAGIDTTDCLPAYVRHQLLDN